MAEMLLSTLATTSTGAAIAGPLSTALNTMSFGSLLSPALSVLGAVGQIQSGAQQSAVYKAQAAQYELAAKQEELRGREQADRIRRSLQENLATQRAVFSARGIALNSGTPVSIASQSKTAAAQDIDTVMFNAGQDAFARRSMASQSKIQASSARTTGYANAASALYGNKDAFGSLLR